MKPPQVALITGAARRIGAAIARELHAAGMNVVLHHRSSAREAQRLASDLNTHRAHSAALVRADLLDVPSLPDLAHAAHAQWGRLDALVNNASSYFKTPLARLTEAQFEELVGSNLRAPLFLAQACVRHMKRGAIVNIVDVHTQRPLPGFSAYGAAKAGLAAVTEILARELAPNIRVNGVAPGHILWAETHKLGAAAKKNELARVPMRRLGTPEEIAHAVRFLVSPEAAYLNGAIIPVDGGLRLA
jgi:pteridine reductase